VGAIFCDHDQERGKRVRVGRVKEQCRIASNFRQRRSVGKQAGDAEPKALGHREAEAFISRRYDQEVGMSEEARNRGIVDVTRRFDSGDRGRNYGVLMPQASDYDKSMSETFATRRGTKRRHQSSNVLVRATRAEGQKVWRRDI
jgi:hypothetical protein